jgi:3-hydroxy-5-methyl-1-naphthoate 3-O-methyltransferase
MKTLTLPPGTGLRRARTGQLDLRRRFARDAGTTRKSQRAPTPERLLEVAWGYAPPLILEAALEHRVFDLLERTPRTAEALAARCGVSRRGMSAILNALVGLEFLERRGDRFALTPVSAAFLVSTKPAYHGGLFRHMTRQLIPRWLGLSTAVQTGRPVVAANQEDNGAEFFAQFVESLFPLSYAAAQKLGEHLGIPRTRVSVSVLDIGAGSGVWGIALAQQSPLVHIHAVDWPRVLAVTKAVAQRHGVGDRLTTAGGDLLEADFGQGHQVATIGHILHSEGRERSRQLLRKTFGALAPGGTVAISEVMPNADRTGPPTALIFAVNMLVHTEEGDTFTFAEISEWLREAGFKRPLRLEAPAPSPLVLATRP